MNKETFIVIGEQKDKMFDLHVDKFSFAKWEERDVEYDREPHNEELRERVKELYKQINEMLDNLTPTSRDRLVRYIKGENQEDIARDYNVSQPAIHYNIRNSMNKLGWEEEHIHTIKMVLIYGELYLDL